MYFTLLPWSGTQIHNLGDRVNRRQKFPFSNTYHGPHNSIWTLRANNKSNNIVGKNTTEQSFFPTSFMTLLREPKWRFFSLYTSNGNELWIHDVREQLKCWWEHQCSNWYLLCRVNLIGLVFCCWNEKLPGFVRVWLLIQIFKRHQKRPQPITPPVQPGTQSSQNGQRRGKEKRRRKKKQMPLPNIYLGFCSSASALYASNYCNNSG